MFMECMIVTIYYVLCCKIVSIVTYTKYAILTSVVQDVTLKCMGVFGILCAVVSIIDERERAVRAQMLTRRYRCVD